MLFNERTSAVTTVKTSNTMSPYVFISREAISKMALYVKGCSDEIGWLGTVEQFDKNGYLIKDVFLFDQEVHSTTTEITPEGLAEFGEALLQQPDGMDIWNEMRLWGHSHVNMDIHPSGQDDTQMNTFADGGHDFFIRLIANKKGEMKIDLYRYDIGIEYHNVKWAIYQTDEEALIQQEIEKLQKQLQELEEAPQVEMESVIKEEIKEKVRRKTYTYNYHPSTKWGNSRYGYWQGGQHKAAEQEAFTDETEEAEDYYGDDYEAYQGYDARMHGILDYGEPFFNNDMEVRQEIGIADLQELGTYADKRDVAEELTNQYGYFYQLTLHDLDRVCKVAKEEAKKAMAKLK